MYAYLYFVKSLKNADNIRLNNNIHIFFTETPIENDNGIPHALEHLVFLRSGAIESKQNFLDYYVTQRLCTQVNASTLDDHTW